MTEQGVPPPERLDSWKAIADYLGRDVATVRRWERLHKLPVRRIAGPGRSVFAYVTEIDEWLRARPGTEVTKVTVEKTESVIEDVPPERGHRIRRWPWAAAGLLAVSALWWSIPLLTSGSLPVRGEFIDTAIVMYSKSGAEAWRYSFGPENRIVRKATYSEVRVLSGTPPGVLAATSYYEQFDKHLKSGQLLWFTPKGKLTRTFAFDDLLVMGGKPYQQPWVMTDFRAYESNGQRRIAVSARDNNWWPSVVTVLDGEWRRTGTFVNTGWVQQLHWLSSDKLLLSGFSNPFDGGMVAIVNAGALDGQSPPSDKAEFSCPSCGDPAAMRYVVLPRSEVNRASGAGLNEARPIVQDNRVIVHTIEVNRHAESVEAIYEFSLGLELERATYGDRYWEMHRELEAAGRLDHPRERCPDRDGPPEISVWDRTAGWQKVSTRSKSR
jgi:hypothetical protein